MTKKWKDITPKALYALTRILIAAEWNCGKRHVDEI
jgi:hypothetical protein